MFGVRAPEVPRVRECKKMSIVENGMKEFLEVFFLQTIMLI